MVGVAELILDDDGAVNSFQYEIGPVAPYTLLGFLDFEVTDAQRFGEQFRVLGQPWRQVRRFVGPAFSKLHLLDLPQIRFFCVHDAPSSLSVRSGF